MIRIPQKIVRENWNFIVYPKKTSEIDYNRFSPYTPIQYYVDPVTKYQHHHIDLVSYLNENQVNYRIRLRYRPML